VSSQGQVRLCACGTRLASDNPGARCGACQHRRASGLGGAPVVPAEFWVSDRMSVAFASRHMGKVVYAFRTHPWHGGAISQAVVAGWARASQGLVSRIESEPPLRDLDRLAHWARVLRIPARLLWFELDIPETAGRSPGEGEPGHPVAMLDEVSPSRRRDFVASGGLAAVGGLAAGAGLEALERELDLIHIMLDRGTTSEERTSYFEQVARDLGVQAAEATPATLVKPTLGALRSIRTLLEQRQPTSQQIRLVRATAMTSQVAREVMFSIGQIPRARAWCQAAEKAAADAGDRYLLDIAVGGQAILLTYCDDPKGVLRLVSPRLDGRATPSPALARLWGFKARAHAALGEASEFSRSIESARQALGNSRRDLICPGIFSCTPAKLDFTEATGAVQLRMPATAISAADRALLSDRRTSEHALTRLERASALAQSGEVDQACREATDTLLDPSTQHHRTATRTYARKFNEVIKGINSPATREWHQAHAEKHGQKRSPA
jgi:hypothetical protein